MSIFTDIRNAKSAASDRLLKIPGVTGVAIGAKEKAGKFIDGELAIVVFVEKKKNKNDIKPEHLVPEFIDGFKTDVVQFGRFSLYADIYGGGGKLESDDGVTGTLGCFAKKTDGTNKVVILSCQHVLYGLKDTTKHGKDTGPRICTWCSCCSSIIIGKTIDAELSQDMDAAIAEVKPGVQYLAEIEGIGVIKGSTPVARAEIDQPMTNPYHVKKRGFKTGLTSGVMTFIDADIQHTDGTHFNVDGSPVIIVTLKNQYVVVSSPRDRFADPGDSGAVVLNNENKVVGMIVGGSVNQNQSKHATFITPIPGILSRFHIEIEKAQNPGEVRIVAATAPSIAGSQPLPGGLDLDTPGRFHMLSLEKDRITGTAKGLSFFNAFEQHREEIRHLVNQNKTVATVWQRNRGPAIINLFVKYIENRTHKFPLAINGRSFKDCVFNIMEVFKKFGSRDLVEEFKKVERLIADIDKMGYEEFVSNKFGV
jgi:hypothetical protein